MENIFKQNPVPAIFFRVSTDLLNSENLKVAFAQLCNELKCCNFSLVQLPQRYVNNTFKENTVNATIIKMQLIYSTMRT